MVNKRVVRSRVLCPLREFIELNRSVANQAALNPSFTAFLDLPSKCQDFVMLKKNKKE